MTKQYPIWPKWEDLKLCWLDVTAWNMDPKSINYGKPEDVVLQIHKISNGVIHYQIWRDCGRSSTPMSNKISALERLIITMKIIPDDEAHLRIGFN
jgi:hypothetical protein